MRTVGLFPNNSFRYPVTHECVIYHDESKKVFGDVWAHAQLFVPEPAADALLGKLWEKRKKHGCEDIKLRFADISGSKICGQDGSVVIQEWLQYAVEALRSKGSVVFRPPLNCKLGIIFFHTSVDLDMYGGGTKGEKRLRYFETVFRMLLKGGAHYLFSNDNRLTIKGIVTDGEPWHRRLDETRILDRLMSDVREYVTVDENAYIEAIVSRHRSPSCTDENKAQFLQLTDLLLGSIIHSCFRDLRRGTKKEILIRPVKQMLEKRRRGRKFQHSGHYKSFTLSLASIANDQWEFQQIDTKEIIYEGNQLRFFEFNESIE